MEVKLLIDGQDMDAGNGSMFERFDPVTGELATRASAATVSDVDQAIDAAGRAFLTWSKTGPAIRRDLLLNAATIMESKIDAFAKLMTQETGATAPWAVANVMQAASMLREAASMTTQINGEIIPTNKPRSLALAMRKPVGVCVGIAPWNAPVVLGTRAIAMAIACGNTVVLKASELSPATHRLIGNCMVEAGFPNGVINIISNAPEDAAKIVERLVTHSKVARINFTGSTKVGKIISKMAAEHLKPVLLELGGKAPVIVLDDANIEAAVNAVIFGAFMNQGQICMSTERIIVDEKIADKFVEQLAKRAASLPAGDPRGKVVLGSLVSEQSAFKMEELIKDAIAKGAKVVAGGKRDGAIFHATLIDGVNSGMRIYKEETFGPVKPIIRVNGDEEAIIIANDTEYGLAAAVFGKDIQRAMDVADQIESGICHINGPTLSNEPQMPFGGVKNSGHGRFGGKAAIAEFTDLRWVTIEDPNQQYPF